MALMQKNDRYLRGISPWQGWCLSLLLLLMAGLPVFAKAQSSDPAPTVEAKFSANDAAYCMAVYGWIIEYLIPNGMPKEPATQAQMAFLIWGYELTMAAPGVSEEQQNITAHDAIERLDYLLPDVVDDASAKQAIDIVISEAGVCADKIKKRYPEGSHPIIKVMQAEKQKRDMLRQDPGIPLK